MMPVEIFMQSRKKVNMKTLKYIAIGATLVTAFAAGKPEPSPRIEFDALESYPEGIAFDQPSNQYYVSSARLGNIGKVSPQGVYSVLHADSTLKSTYGIMTTLFWLLSIPFEFKVTTELPDRFIPVTDCICDGVNGN